MSILNLSEAPTDAIERLMWLSGVRKQANAELDTAWREAYFDARLTGRLADAIALRQHARKSILAFTRAENESRGRVIRNWRDGF